MATFVGFYAYLTQLALVQLVTVRNTHLIFFFKFQYFKYKIQKSTTAINHADQSENQDQDLYFHQDKGKIKVFYCAETQ